MAAWGQWAKELRGSIVDPGAPLGKTLKVNQSGVSKTANLITGFVVVSSHEEAAAIFKRHPHFAVVSADNSVEIIQCMEMPST
ncbi:hypothetical protein [Devosia nitrariae]|uniref:hypothetical protein n=1 Tax=Devosia nitrariae TaxID=2071872 RepID=UPI0024E18BB6|nr:hypothetical protein [Devosia nitrariae]